MVPVAGFGTRLLPATRSQPKDMLALAGKPLVQYVAEELLANGGEQILCVTSRNRTSIENQFNSDPDLVRQLSADQKQDLLDEISLDNLGTKFFCNRQPVQRGSADAIQCGKNVAGEQLFVVVLGDSMWV